MKKLLFTCLIMFSFLNMIYSQETEQTEPSKKNYYLFDYPQSFTNNHNHSISTMFTTPFDAAHMDNCLAMNLGYSYSNLYTKASGGIQTSNSNVKFYLSNTTWLINQVVTDENNQDDFSIRFGVKTFYNLIHYNELVTYNNILFGVESDFKLPKTFSLNLQFLFDITIGSIDTGTSDSITINWWDIALNVTLYYALPANKDLVFYLNMSNFDNYTIQRFFAPVFTPGVKYDSPYNFSVSAEFNLHYTDLFSFSRYLEYAAFSLRGEYRF